MIAFDRSRGRGIVELDGRAVVVDASHVDASHLSTDDVVEVELAAGDRIVAVRIEQAVPARLATDARGLFAALLDAQDGAPPVLLERLAARDDLAPLVGAWLSRWDRAIRFWEPDNVAALVDRRPRDEALSQVLVLANDAKGPADRTAWLHARLLRREA